MRLILGRRMLPNLQKSRNFFFNARNTSQLHLQTVCAILLQMHDVVREWAPCSVDACAQSSISRWSGMADRVDEGNAWDVQGVQLDASSAGALHESLQALRRHEDPDLLEIMQLLVTKPMQVRVCPSSPACSGAAEGRPAHTVLSSPMCTKPGLIVPALYSSHPSKEALRSPKSIFELLCKKTLLCCSADTRR